MKSVRFIILIFFSIILMSIGLARMFYIATLEYHVTPASIIQCGAILDRNSIPIASTIETYSISVTDKIDDDTLELLFYLIPNIDRAKIIKRIQNKCKFTWIAHKVSTNVAEEIRKMKNKEISLHKTYTRFYPYSNIFSHIIGFRHAESGGHIGIEKEITDTSHIIHTTLDVSMQSYLYHALHKYKEKFSADSAFGIVIKNDGEIRAAVSLPDFDPNHVDGLNQFNAITQGIYEFGSVLKIFTYALGVEANIPLDRIYNVPAVYKIDKYFIKDVRRHPQLTFTNAFRESSNIVSIMLVKELGNQVHYDFLRKVGLFEKLTIDRINIKNTSAYQWSNVLSQSMSYGYGIAFSPIQLSYGLCNIFHERKVTPTIIKKNKPITMSQQQIYQHAKTMLHLITRPNNTPGLIGFKTGTSHVVVDGKYSNKKFFVSCCAIIGDPENPHICIIGITNPSSDKEILSMQFTLPVVKEFVHDAYSALWN